MSKFYQAISKTVFLWGVTLLHLYLLFSENRVNAAEFSITSAEPSRCPFKRAKQFFGTQTFLLTSSLLYGERSATLSRKFSRKVDLMNFGMYEHSPLEYIRDAHLIRHNTALHAEVVGKETKSTLKDAPAVASAEGGKKKKKQKRQADGLECVVLGLSHHNAKVEIREKLAIPEAEWNAVSTQLCESDAIAEAAVLSTCNRFEIYLSGKNQYACIQDAVNFLVERAGGTIDPLTLRQNLFMLSGEDAIWHLLKVSAGLDSLVVGEGQILSQVKRAYEHGIEEDGQAGKVLSRMLNTAVSAGKRVRSETGISKGAVSISSAAAEFTATKLESDCAISTGMRDAKITIIGAGKMARLLLIHLATQGVTAVTIVNRSPERVNQLQEEFPDMEIELRLMDDMWDVIRESDVVYPSTAATTTIIDPEPLKKAMEGPRTRPGGVQFVDISVPRNVDPACAEVPGIFCYNVDDLKAVVARNTAKRRREMVEAEGILREEQDKFRLWQQSLGAIPTIAKLQDKAETLRREEMAKATKKLSSLSEKDLETVEKVTKGIVAKLLHGPMSHLRQQKEGDATRAAIQQVQEAFQLEQ